MQGCSTLSTEAPLGEGIESGESGSVSVLIEGAGLISAQHIVGEAAQSSEDTWVVTDAGSIFLEGDVTRVVQRVFDVPVVSDCDGSGSCRYAEIGRIICHLGGAAPQTGLGTSMQDIASDADDDLDQGRPLCGSNSVGRAEHVDSPGFTSVACDGDLSVTAEGLLEGTGGFGILQQGGLIFL